MGWELGGGGNNRVGGEIGAGFAFFGFAWGWNLKMGPCQEKSKMRDVRKKWAVEVPGSAWESKESRCHCGAATPFRQE